MDDRTIDRVFAGCLEELPPVSSKIVRIFTSSTFTDTQLERNTLMAEVYPKIKEYCREKHGLEFQVVDMRWGVRDEATDDHMTTELCLREIVNCQRLSMGPNFVVFLGQKYGYRPIPTYIVATELILLKETLTQMGVDIHLLDLWYKKDTNAVPHIFILQPISTILVNFNNKRVPKLQAQDQAIWWDSMCKMQKLFRKASHACFVNGKMDADAMHNYFMSVTEREVINGILNVENTKAHCLSYVRYINNINLQNIKKASNFIDIINRSVDAEASRLLSDLRDVRLPNKIESTNSQNYTVEWMGREGLSKDTHDEYLSHFLAHFYKNIIKLVDRAMRKEDSSAQGVIVTEILQHLHACNNSVKVFYGREESLKRAKAYLLGEGGDCTKPLILYGAGGCGKTSLLAKSAAMAFPWYAERNAVPLLILRFLGTTPDSSAIAPMLISLCQQISYNFMLPMEDIPDDLVPLTAHFKELLTYGTDQQPLIVFLDSVDQLTGATGANKLTWLPSKLHKHCKIVISCVYEPEIEEISRDYQLLRRILNADENFIEVAPLGEELATVIVRRWLKAANRDVTNYQWRVVCNALGECSLPIFVKLVFAEICRWKSYSKPQDTKLANNVMDSIFKLFERIEIQHGRLLVTHALAYITAAKSGLSETELEDLISLDDKVLDDVYQYHMPPVRRIPPLLWTRIRNDLPNYLSEREADGVSVLSWYHRQFREAAVERYFKDEDMSIYFHSSIADYFLGIWGGGVPKPFQYTEIQRHRFNLPNRNGIADRKVPLQPLVFVGKDGKISRYNLRKFGELPYHLVRAKRFSDLYDNVLFNYHWIYAKISSCPLQSCLSDFEDACNYIEDRDSAREIMLVADALRLGGAILMHHPQMLGPQITGRLLPEIAANPNVKRLLQQCDVEGKAHNALIPSYHCMHTPGGPLKYSLEGHQFAVFGFCLTADYRYVVSISNKFITWDLSTSDMSREVIPNIEGVLQGLVLSPDNRYAAAFSNINKIILLNTLTSEFVVLDNPLEGLESVVGIWLLNTHLIVYGMWSWVVYNNLTAEPESTYSNPDSTRPILRMEFHTLNDYFMILWSGDLDDTNMQLFTCVDGEVGPPVDFHGALAIAPSREKIYTCIIDNRNDVVEMNFRKGEWNIERVFEGNNDMLNQLQLSEDETYIIAAFMFGYKLWNIETDSIVTLLLPDRGIRNISSKLLESNACVLSKDNIYAIAGVRKNLYVWDVKTGELLKDLDAHFGRIIKICSVTVGNWNSVVTSSIDRTVKVWNINNIFEQVHAIDRHELQIDSISISVDLNVAAVSTRNCVGIWDLKLGKLLTKLTDSPLGAIVTHAKITTNGKFVVTVESGNLLIWNMAKREVIFKEPQEGIRQIFFIDKCSTLITVMKPSSSELKVKVLAREMPSGTFTYEFEFPIKSLRDSITTSDGSLLVCPGFEKLKDTLFVHNSKTGVLVNKIVLKYHNFKDYMFLQKMPKRATQVAIIDADKGSIIDTKTKRFIRSVPKWGGHCTKDGKFGLYAPGRGGLELIDLKHGKTVRTFIPKVAEGVFTIVCMFNKTNEYVFYYHGGRKTIRVFRTSDAEMVANYRVHAELSAIESTEDGKSLVLGTVDGCLTTLAIADPDKEEMGKYLEQLPSRDEEFAKKASKKKHPIFRTAAKMAVLGVRAQKTVRLRTSLTEAVEKGSGIDLMTANIINQTNGGLNSDVNGYSNTDENFFTQKPESFYSESMSGETISTEPSTPFADNLSQADDDDDDKTLKDEIALTPDFLHNGYCRRVRSISNGYFGGQRDNLFVPIGNRDKCTLRI